MPPTTGYRGSGFPLPEYPPADLADPDFGLRPARPGVTCRPGKRRGRNASPGRVRQDRLRDLPAAHPAARWGKLRSNTPSAMRFFRISIEPPAIIHPRQRRRQYSTSDSRL